MKYYFFLLFSIIFISSYGQELNIPDVNFKNKLLNAGLIDANDNGVIDIEDAENFYGDLNLNNTFDTDDADKITDLTGIEYFVNITSLSFDYNLVETVDISNNILITSLSALNNKLTSIDVSTNVMLERLSCSNNPISSIDVSKNAKLTRLIASNVPLNAIDLSNNPLLEFFISGDSQMKSLDFSSNPNMILISGSSSYLLESVNLKGVNIENIGRLWLRFCPRLRTICVDDAVLAQSELSSRVDPHGTFVEDCTTNIELNEINGTLTFDSNLDGCTVSDIKIPNTLVKATFGENEFSTLTDSNGDYSISVVKNSFDVFPYQLNQNAHLNTNPESVNHSFTGYNETTTIDFCTTINENENDVDVIIIPTSEISTNSVSTYQLVYENLGTTTNSGVVNLEYNTGKLTFVSAQPNENSSNSNIITFNYSNLQPFEKRIIDLSFNTLGAPILNEGDDLTFVATINSNETENNSDNNIYTFDQIVGSTNYANEKQVLQGAEITVDELTNYLDYVIRFQNTGETIASHIAITDIIGTNYDWNSIRIVSSSHSFKTNITDGRFVEFLFENINLPTQQEDEQGSKGFISFRVKPTENLEVGDVVFGKTEIYYAFNTTVKNFSLKTENDIVFTKSEEFNIVETRIVSSDILFLDENNLNSSLKLFPNPTNSFINLSGAKGLKIKKIEFYNSIGKKLFETNDVREKYDLSKYNSGLYFMLLQTEKGILYKRVVKK